MLSPLWKCPKYQKSSHGPPRDSPQISQRAKFVQLLARRGRTSGQLAQRSRDRGARAFARRHRRELVRVCRVVEERFPPIRPGDVVILATYYAESSFDLATRAQRVAGERRPERLQLWVVPLQRTAKRRRDPK